MALFHDTLIVHDIGTARLSYYTLEGTLLRTVTTGLHTSGMITVDTRGTVRIPVHNLADNYTWMRWIDFNSKGERVDSLGTTPVPVPKVWRANIPQGSITFSIPYTPQDMAALAPDGTVVLGSTASFNFRKTRTGRDTVRLFRITNIPSVPLDSALRDSLFRLVTRGAPPELRAAAHEADMPTTAPAWNDIAVDDHGYIWVTSDNLVKHSFFVAILSPDGFYLGALIGSFGNLRVASWNGDHAATITVGADHRQAVTVYRLDRRGM
jgi:hypothetical protein